MENWWYSLCYSLYKSLRYCVCTNLGQAGWQSGMYRLGLLLEDSMSELDGDDSIASNTAENTSLRRRARATRRMERQAHLKRYFITDLAQCFFLHLCSASTGAQRGGQGDICFETRTFQRGSDPKGVSRWLELLIKCQKINYF